MMTRLWLLSLVLVVACSSATQQSDQTESPGEDIVLGADLLSRHQTVVISRG